MKILVVEDDNSAARSIELMLTVERMTVDIIDEADEALDMGKVYDFDLMILADIPRAADVLRGIRAAKVKLPIIRISAKNGIAEKVVALNAGADDYMPLPFHKDELVARIHAIVRRSHGHAQSVITAGDVTVNLDTRTASVGAQHLALTGKEFQMLELLALRKNLTITKEAMLNHLYGGRDEPEVKIIDVFICKLRKKLAYALDDGVTSPIETVWGRGYVLRDAPTPSVPA